MAAINLASLLVVVSAKANTNMGAILLASLITFAEGTPTAQSPELLASILARDATNPDSGSANGAIDTGPHVSTVGWTMVGLFSAGAVFIFCCIIRHYAWSKMFSKKKVVDVELGNRNASSA